MAEDKINIIIGYDQRIIADGLSAIASTDKRLKVIHSVKNSDAIFDLVETEKPNVILFEFERWIRKYLLFVKKFSRIYPWLRILIVSEFISHRFAEQVIPFIHGYLLRTCSSEKVLLAINQIVDSGKYLCPEVIDEFVVASEKRTDVQLTLREKDILSKWLASKNNKDVALSMNISESTVRSHLNNIKQKLGTINKMQLMLFACSNNLVDADIKPMCPNCRFFNDHF
jgi:DNA-binding NarL/FixJ family response regulator